MRRIITIIISVILLNVQLFAFQTKIIYQKGQKLEIVSGELCVIVFEKEIWVVSRILCKPFRNTS